MFYPLRALPGILSYHGYMLKTDTKYAARTTVENIKNIPDSISKLGKKKEKKQQVNNTVSKNVTTEKKKKEENINVTIDVNVDNTTGDIKGVKVTESSPTNKNEVIIDTTARVIDTPENVVDVDITEPVYTGPDFSNAAQVNIMPGVQYETVTESAEEARNRILKEVTPEDLDKAIAAEQQKKDAAVIAKQKLNAKQQNNQNQKKK